MKKPRAIIAVIGILFLAMLALQGRLGDVVPETNPVPSAGNAVAAGTLGDAPADAAPGDLALIVRNVVIRDVDGRIAYSGDVDLAPAMRRIEAGERDPHRNDGGVFGNREGLLPARPQGYYREYVVRTPGMSHAGPQRLVLGDAGEIYFTADHYASFVRVR